MFWSVEDFCDGFLKLIDHLELDKVKQAPHGYCMKSLLHTLLNIFSRHIFMTAYQSLSGCLLVL